MKDTETNERFMTSPCSQALCLQKLFLKTELEMNTPLQVVKIIQKSFIRISK